MRLMHSLLTVAIYSLIACVSHADLDKINGRQLVVSLSDDIAYIDGSIASLKLSNGRILSWYNTGRGRAFKYEGTLADPLQTLLYNKEENDVFTPSLPSGWRGWMVNVWAKSSTELIAFVHCEFREVQGTKPLDFKLGLAYSDDQGDTWKWCGFIIDNFAADAAVNQGGVPFVLKDGFLYIYYNDNTAASANDPAKSRLAVARAPWVEVIREARKTKVSSWNKFYGGQFNEPGLGGRAAAIIGSFSSHGDAFISTVDNRVYLFVLTQQRAPGGGIVCYSSADGVRSWRREGGNFIDRARDIKIGSRIAYMSVVAAGGNLDSTSFGGRFSLYYAYSATGKVQNLQELYRQELIVR